MTDWPPKDLRALIALLGSIAGAAVLTGVVLWGMWMLMPADRWWTAATEAHRVETIRIVLWIAAGTIALAIGGLGFAINRRSIRGKFGRDGAEFGMEGGEDELPPLKVPDVEFGPGTPPNVGSGGNRNG